MIQWAKQTGNRGFTIVELLIVIVVIAILAAITIVAYNGIQQRARTSALQSELTNASKALDAARYRTTTELYPSTLAEANISLSDATYIYEPLDNSFCLTKTNDSLSYYVSNSQKNPKEGSCGNDTMISWWRLNGNATDSIGSNNGTVVNAALTTGQNGQPDGAYQFNGSNATINFGNSTAFNQRNLTMSVWARPSSTAAIHMFLGKEQQYKYRITSSGVASALFATTGSGWTANYSSAGSVIPVGAWSHVVYTIDSDRSIARTYVNGALVASSPMSAPITAFNANSLYLGSTQGANEWFSGALDDVRFYNRPLGAAEVKGLYSAGAQ